MIRTQIQLTEEQAVALRRIAAKRRRSVAGLVRGAVDRILKEEGGQTLAGRQQRALAAVGQFGSGYSNVSVEHDRFLDKSYCAS